MEKTDKLKITFVLPHIGLAGGNRAIFECANRLIERGHEINIVYPLVPTAITVAWSPRQALKTVFHVVKNLRAGKGVAWYDLQARTIRITAISGWLSFFSLRALPAADIIVASNVETSFFVARLGGRPGRKLYFSQHYEIWDVWNNAACWEQLNDRKGTIKEISLEMARLVPRDDGLARYKRRIDESYKLPLRIFTTSLWLQELLEKQLGCRTIGRVDIGNNFDHFGTSQRRPRAGKRLLIPYRGVGWKGGAEGLAACELIKKARPDCEFRVFGYSKFEHIMPPWIKYYSQLSDKELNDLYEWSDIFVLPSWAEGWSSPPMEAMACGAACVCTDVGAVSDYSVPGKSVVLVPARNAAAIAEACLNLLADNEKLNDLAQAGYDHIRRFTWERTVEQMEKIFIDEVRQMSQPRPGKI